MGFIYDTSESPVEMLPMERESPGCATGTEEKWESDWWQRPWGGQEPAAILHRRERWGIGLWGRGCRGHAVRKTPGVPG